MKQNSIERQRQVRDLKAQGMSYRAVAEKLGLTEQMAQYYGRPSPSEHRCKSCLRPLVKAK